MELAMRTKSETAFEQFCVTQGLRFEPIPTEDSEGSKTPDYFIYPANETVAVEVKEIQPNDNERLQRESLEKKGWSTYGGTKVGSRVRAIISTASQQLRTKAKNRYPSVILIYNEDFLLSHHTEPHAIQAAMYGFHTIVLGLSPNIEEKPIVIDRKFGPARKMTPSSNTSVSAIGVLDMKKLILYHNIHAAIPLQAELFKGIAHQFTLAEKRPGEFVEWQELK